MSGPAKHFLFPHGLKRWLFDSARYNQYGLLYNDILYEDKIVEEAIRRLPAHVYDARTFRIVRAMQLDCQKIVLPKEQWTKFEEDHRYLDPYIQEIEREIKEKEEWDKQP